MRGVVSSSHQESVFFNPFFPQPDGNLILRGWNVLTLVETDVDVHGPPPPPAKHHVADCVAGRCITSRVTKNDVYPSPSHL